MPFLGKLHLGGEVGGLSIDQEQGTPQNTPNVQKNSDVLTSPTHCSLHSQSVQFFSFPGLLYFFTEFIFLQFTELHELIKESDKHQTHTKKAAGLEAEASF